MSLVFRHYLRQIFQARECHWPAQIRKGSRFGSVLVGELACSCRLARLATGLPFQLRPAGHGDYQIVSSGTVMQMDNLLLLCNPTAYKQYLIAIRGGGARWVCGFGRRNEGKGGARS